MKGWLIIIVVFLLGLGFYLYDQSHGGTPPPDCQYATDC